MKIRYPIIVSTILLVAIIIVNADFSPVPWHLQETIAEILGILWLISIGLIIYLVIRNIFRAIIGTMKKPKEP